MRYTTEQILQQLRTLKIVPVIALDKAQDILPLGKILIENGLPVAEITFRSAAAQEAICLLRHTYPEMLIAAGTVLTAEQVVQAKEAGADFVVTPGFNPKIVQLCQDLQLPITPGVNSTMAIEAALDRGITAVKFFPAEASGGVKMIKALVAPYSQLQIMPTGGIGLHNIQDYLAIPNVVACGGSWFVEKSLINGQNWQEIEKLTQEVLQKVQNV